MYSFVLGAIPVHQMINLVHHPERRMEMPVHNLEMIRDALNPLLFLLLLFFMTIQSFSIQFNLIVHLI